MADNAISFGQIPRTSRLYNDFLYNFDRVSRFYQSSGLDISALAARAQKVTAQTFSLNAVPMFWVAAEDHDFEEVNHTRLLNREGQLVTITYAGCPPKEGKPVGHVKLNEKIGANIDELVAALPESEFMPRLGSDLRDSYKAGVNFAEAFGRM